MSMLIGDGFWIGTDSGQRADKVDGKALRLRETLILEDPDGHELATIQERVARIRDSMEIQDADGHRRAMVRDPAVVLVIAAAIILWGVLPVRLRGRT